MKRKEESSIKVSKEPRFETCECRWCIKHIMYWMIFTEYSISINLPEEMRLLILYFSLPVHLWKSRHDFPFINWLQTLLRLIENVLTTQMEIPLDSFNLQEVRFLNICNPFVRCEVDIPQFTQYMTGLSSPLQLTNNEESTELITYQTKLDTSVKIMGENGRFRIIFEYNDRIQAKQPLSSTIDYIRKKIHSNLFLLLAEIYNKYVYASDILFIDMYALTELMRNYVFGLISAYLYNTISNWSGSCRVLRMLLTAHESSIRFANCNEPYIDHHWNILDTRIYQRNTNDWRNLHR